MILVLSFMVKLGLVLAQCRPSTRACDENLLVLWHLANQTVSRHSSSASFAESSKGGLASILRGDVPAAIAGGKYLGDVWSRIRGAR